MAPYFKFPTERSSDEDFNATPEGRAEAASLLERWQALEAEKPGPELEARREALRERAAAIGLQLKTLTISLQPLPDPVLDALPASELRAIEALHRAMYSNPAGQLGKIRALIAKHPNIPVLRNHLASALQHAGHDAEAAAVLAACVKQFPLYLFGFCNCLMMLLADDRVDEARELVETGPRGRLFSLNDFDPSREVFHVSEAITYASAIGQHFVATGRVEAAMVQMGMLLEIAPESAQAATLAAVLPRKALTDVCSRVLAGRGAEDSGARVKKSTKAKAPKKARKARPTTKKAKSPSPVKSKDTTPRVFNASGAEVSEVRESTPSNGLIEPKPSNTEVRVPGLFENP